MTNQPNSSPAANPVAKLTNSEQHPVTVLLVDDQAIIGEAVRRMLKPEADIVFHFLNDPTKAVEAAIALKPTVILQDLVMPGMDGLTLAKAYRARAETRDIPLIVLSTKEEPATKAEAFSIGANDYLVKLPDRIELIARIRYHSRGYISLLQRNEAYLALDASQKELAKEVAQAAHYVQSLLPPPLKGETSGGVTIDWRFVPSLTLGGDSFGYHWLDDDHLALYLLDVCGHGVGAALLSVSAMNVLRSSALAKTDFRKPNEVMAGLNDAFQMEKHNDMYFTIWYGVFHRPSRTLTWSGGGHPPAMVAMGTGADGLREMRTLESLGPMVGAVPGMEYGQNSVQIPVGSKMWIYSDGVFEIHKAGGGMWRFGDFREFMRQSPVPGESDMDRLYLFVKTLQGKETLEDDFSIVEAVFG